MNNIHHAFYINLDRREDRRKEFEEECKRMEITVERFPAIAKTPGILGCHSSHLAVLKKAREMNYPNVLIFEDDFKFLVDKETFETQLNSFFQSKIDYDVLFLSYNVTKSEPLNELVSYGKDIVTASGYIVNQKFYDKLIENLETNYRLLEKTLSHWLYLNDQCWKPLQKDNAFLYFNKRIGMQRDGYSDLSCFYKVQDC
jgi:GR25 family glycosyltransferase involved in LPS biosynthesis